MINKTLFLIFISMTLCSCYTQELAPVEYKGNNFYGFEFSEPVEEVYTERTQRIISEDKISSSRKLTSNQIPDYIIVKDGEDIAKIASIYSIKRQDLIRANALKKPYKLQTGQILNMPNFIFHEVGIGENLQVIAKIYDQNPEIIKELNNLQSPYNLRAGQILKIAIRTNIPEGAALNSALHPDAKISKAKGSAVVLTKPAAFIMPVTGKVIKTYGLQDVGVRNDGINILAAKGEAVKAVAAGKILYAGSELKGYGNLIIIQHSNNLMTAYAHLDDKAMRKDDFVHRGQVIGHVGNSGNVKTPQLYFAIRKGKTPVDPANYLPKFF